MATSKKPSYKAYRANQDIQIGDAEMGKDLTRGGMIRSGEIVELDPEHAVTKALYQQSKIVETKEESSSSSGSSSSGGSGSSS